MATELNRPALENVRRLVRDGAVVRDERDDWSGAAPSADEENRFIEQHGWTAFSHWHLGIDKDESRAGQHDHDEIRDELRKLLELIDGES